MHAMRHFIQAILQILGVLTTGGAIGGLATCVVMAFHGHWWIALGALIISVLSFVAVDFLADLSVSASMK